MKEFKKLKAPIEGDLFSIWTVESTGERYIKIWGYVGYGDNWYLTECSWCELPLKEYVAHLKENEDYAVEVMETECKQYQIDYADNEIGDLLDSINRYYFDGACADHYLQLKDVTMETPDGNYFSTQAVFDVNGTPIKVGDTVIWKDPDPQGVGIASYEVDEVREDMVRLSNKHGECEALPQECAVVNITPRA